MEIETILISKKEYDDLVDSQILLECLEMMGVDNWSGYDDARSEYRRILKEEE